MNAFPREGTHFPGKERSEDQFFSHEKVSLSAVVGKKDGCLTDQSSCTQA